MLASLILHLADFVNAAAGKRQENGIAPVFDGKIAYKIARRRL